MAAVFFFSKFTVFLYCLLIITFFGKDPHWNGTQDFAVVLKSKIGQ